MLGLSMLLLLRSPFRMPVGERLFRLIWLGVFGRWFVARAGRGLTPAASASMGTTGATEAGNVTRGFTGASADQASLRGARPARAGDGGLAEIAGVVSGRKDWRYGICFSRTTDDPVMASKLSDIEIQRALSARAGWTRRGNALTRTFEFPTFPAAIAFVSRIAEVAEGMNHHPDIDIRYVKITCSLSTHSAGGITSKDFKLAEAIDELVTRDS